MKTILLCIALIASNPAYAIKPITRLGALAQEKCYGYIVDNVLDLKQKQINTISPFPCYCGKATSITHMILDGNCITELPDYGLKQFTALTHLSIQNNAINLIEQYAFYGLTALLELNLNNNQLPSLQRNIFQFQELPTVETLSLSGNRIKFIEDGTFRIIGDALKSLNLSYNKLTELNNSMFHYLVALTTLSLAHNNIRTLQPNCFVDPTQTSYPYNLITIDLSHNLIGDNSGLTADQFMSLTQTQTLILTENPLSQSTVDDLRAALPNITIIFNE